jgi:hypothetical protein
LVRWIAPGRRAKAAIRAEASFQKGGLAMPLKILCVGDVVGKPGRRMLADHLGELISQYQLDLVVCNAENAAGGSGITNQMFRKLLHYGVDAVTLGDHVFRKKEIATSLESSDRIVRPANISAKAAGRPWTVVPTKSGSVRASVACVLGQMYMGNYNMPWETVDQYLAAVPAEVKVRILDFHAEATAEKVAMGWFCNGRASIVFGTHSHIPTADACILDGGTAYITDVGMTGPFDSVLGRKKERVLYAMTTSMPTPFEVALGDPRLNAIVVAVDEQTGKALGIERLEIRGYRAGGLGEREEGAKAEE